MSVHHYIKLYTKQHKRINNVKLRTKKVGNTFVDNVDDVERINMALGKVYRVSLNIKV